ncbi:hypothetical protein H6F47_20870 [Sphaerospermopsis sp. FACHB-1094]|nr:hypothetical protein [Sphaerospermopsis sp. FACHB-1094]MBD2134809.1 hypothetical protein [Sphaerospermopsis sp. FACHB-1094]
MGNIKLITQSPVPSPQSPVPSPQSPVTYHPFSVPEKCHIVDYDYL